MTACSLLQPYIVLYRLQLETPVHGRGIPYNNLYYYQQVSFRQVTAKLTRTFIYKLTYKLTLNECSHIAL